MLTETERVQFDREGFLHVPGVLVGEHLARIRDAFDRLWQRGAPVSRDKLLADPDFIALMEHPPVLGRHRALFGEQTQLLQYDLLQQNPGSNFPERIWHRDFVFPGVPILAANTLLFLDEMDAMRGPTVVVPTSHTRAAYPSAEGFRAPMPDEQMVPCAAGDAIFINGAVWHTGNRNRSAGLRRGVYLYYGYWWLKRYNEHQETPWQALIGATEQRLELLGLKMPGDDLHMYGQPILTADFG